MKLSLLIFCLACVCVTVAQRCSIHKGYYRGNTVNGMEPIRVSTLEDCQVKCYKEPTCYIWSYSDEKKLCLLHTEKTGAIRYLWDIISGNKACGAPGTNEYSVGVTCGTGKIEKFCYECPSGIDKCQGNSTDSDCIWTEGGNCIPRNNEYSVGVTCGTGKIEKFCYECPSGHDKCQGNGNDTDCIWTESGNCIPRGNELDFGPFMDFLREAFTDLENNTGAEIFFPSSDSCSTFKKLKCIAELGKALIDCRKCRFDVQCWISCLKEKICNFSSFCLPGGPCFNDLIKKIASVLGGIFPPNIVEEILKALEVLICSK